MTLPRVTRRKRCRICGKPGWCGYTPDGKMAICMRVEAGSIKRAANGGFIHIFEPGTKPNFSSSKSVPAAQPEPKKRAESELHEVYTDFLNKLPLDVKHFDDLIRRGVTKQALYTQGYKSMPGKPYADAICRQLAAEHNLRHIPGFYFRADGWHFVDYGSATGFPIPIRNRFFQIVGLQLRRDDGRGKKYMMISSADKPRGITSGQPPHFATLKNKCAPSQVKSLIVTEGALKAQIIHEFTDEITVGLVGTNAFNETFPQLLKTAYPNLEKVQIAFDQETFDHAKPDTCAFVHVARQRERLEMTLKKLNLQTSVLSWSRPFKGFDDYLVSLNQPVQNKQAA